MKLIFVFAPLLMVVHASTATPVLAGRDKEWEELAPKLLQHIIGQTGKLEDQLVKLSEQVDYLETNDHHQSSIKAEKSRILQEISSVDQIISKLIHGSEIVANEYTKNLTVKSKFATFQVQMQMLAQDFKALGERVSAIKA